MSWDFFVPVCVGDLVKTGGINQYVVQDVIPAKQLPSHLNSKYFSLDVILCLRTYDWNLMYSSIMVIAVNGSFLF